MLLLNELEKKNKVIGPANKGGPGGNEIKDRTQGGRMHAKGRVGVRFEIGQN